LRLTHTTAETRAAVAETRDRRLTVGLVPTMGALHEGHASLIRLARRESGFVVVSIFVNPTQFGPAEDFACYPRSIEKDLALCEREGADLVFAPDAGEVYGPGFRTFVEVGELGERLCGRSRPGHFRGVATVVLKLLNIVQPGMAFFGQKDAQQARIIRQLVRDLNVPVKIVVCPTVREADGLAVSSRNRYLSAADRRNATVLHQALSEVRARYAAGERDVRFLCELIINRVRATPGAELDYAEIVDAETFQPVDNVNRPAVAALAVRFHNTRLIDNVQLPS
jgi:pantoate--beta-alanine ligase